MADVFDIGELRSADTEELVILHPVTGEPTTWVWTLAGPGHPNTVDADDRRSRESLERDARITEATINRKKWKEPVQTPDQNRKRNAEYFAVRTLGWTEVRIDGADYPFSRENVLKLLLNPSYNRLYQQLVDHMLSETSFTQRSATTSPPSQSETSN